MARTLAIALFTLAALPGLAQAQVRADPAPAGAGNDVEDETVETEDLTVPGAGRSPVHVTTTRTGRVALGVSATVPTSASREARFTDERSPVFCRTPCTLYLRPGTRRLIADAGTTYPWSVEVDVPERGELLVRTRGHLLGLSALGGLVFVLGAAGTVMGPAGIVGGAFLNNSRVSVPLVLAGVGAGVAGIGIAIAGWFIVRAGAPRLESATPRSASVTLRPWLGVESGSLSAGLSTVF